MVTWRDERRRDDAIERIDLTILMICMELILLGITYAIWGLWVPVAIGFAIGWCIIVGVPILFNRLRCVRSKVVDFLDKNWKNWWKYL